MARRNRRPPAGGVGVVGGASLSDASAPVLVLGAGCAGLAAAWRLQQKGLPVTLVEASDHVGGLAGGITLGGDVYEYGPHVFHTTDAEILADIKGLMGADLIPFQRTIRIKFLGNYFRFPLSIPDVLFKLPPWTVARAGFSLLYRFLEGTLVKPAVETSETILRRYYGDVLYKIFFKDYIIRVWGISPAEFSPAFARERIPRLNLLEVIDKARALLRERFGRRERAAVKGYVEKAEGDLYTTRQGFSLITQRMADRLTAGGARILLGARATSIQAEGRRVVSVTVERGDRRETLACSAVVSTLPVNEAALMVSPSLGADVEKAAQALRFRAMVFVGLKVRRPRVLPASFMYFREHSFNRITDLAHFGFQIRPEGRTLLVAEVACDVKDRYWSDDATAREAVIADLERERLLTRGEIEEVHIFRSRHAYPMYTLHYEKALATILGALGGLENLASAGRQGLFQYVNTHIAMRMGYEAADRVAAAGGRR